MVLIIKKTDLVKNAVFNGWYATASYTILGENRQYSPDREAEFGPMKMRRKGELELRLVSVI